MRTNLLAVFVSSDSIGSCNAYRYDELQSKMSEKIPLMHSIFQNVFLTQVKITCWSKVGASVDPNTLDMMMIHRHFLSFKHSTIQIAIPATLSRVKTKMFKVMAIKDVILINMVKLLLMAEIMVLPSNSGLCDLRMKATEKQ